MSFFRFYKIVMAFSTLLLGAGCGSFTRRVDPYPSPAAAQHGTQSYEAQAGSVKPAGMNDGLIAVGAAAVDTALNLRKGPSPASASHQEIRGHCVFREEYPGLGAPTPCVHLGLVLKTVEGVTVDRSRTNENGDFVFSVQQGNERYLIESVSPKFRVLTEPPAPISPRAWVRVELHVI